MYGTIIFFFAYMFAALLLNSSFLENYINFKDIYDILKDGMTITAAFLAPASAFLLFSNWREQYNAQFIDKSLINLMVILKDMEILLNRKGYELNDNAFNNIQKSTSELRFELEHNIVLLKIYPKYINEIFMENITEFKNLSLHLDNKILQLSRLDTQDQFNSLSRLKLSDEKSKKLQELSDIKATLENKITDIRLILLNKT